MTDGSHLSALADEPDVPAVPRHPRPTAAYREALWRWSRCGWCGRRVCPLASDDPMRRVCGANH